MAAIPEKAPRRLLLQNLGLALFPMSVLTVAVWVGLFHFLLPRLETDLFTQKRQMIEQAMAVQLGDLQAIQEQAQKGVISDSAAIRLMKASVGRQRFGKSQTGYFWIIGEDQRLLVHELMPHLVGGNPDTLVAPDGKPLSRMLAEMRQVAEDRPAGGIVEYLWIHDSTTHRTSRKLSFVRKFSPRNWVVGTGVYLDDVEQEFTQIRISVLVVGAGLLAVLGLLSLWFALRAYRLQERSALLFWEARAQENRFKVLLETIPIGAVLQDAEGKVLQVNQALKKMIGKPESEYRNRRLDECGILSTQSDSESGQILWSLQSQNGEHHLLLSPGDPVALPAHHPPLFLKTYLDVTEVAELTKDNQSLKNEIDERSSQLTELDATLKNRQEDLGRLRKQLDIASRVFENSGDAVMITDAQAKILSVNPAFTAITGYTASEVVGHPPRILQSQRHSPDFYVAMWRTLLETKHYSSEIWNRRKSGEAFPCYSDITAVMDDQGTVTEYIAVYKDLSDLQRSRDQLAHLNEHDPLTGLRNHQTFVSALYASCTQARQNESHLAIAILGIDRFGRVNKAHGYLIGDKLLQAIARRLEENLGNTAILGRFAGDEFACTIPYRKHSWEAIQQLEKLKGSLAEPFVVDGEHILMTTSVGVALFPDDTTDPEALPRLASISLDRAKQDSGNALRPYTDDLHASLDRRLSLENAMRQGIERGEFQMYYQPKIRLSDGKCIGAEALMRWFKADGTFVSPAEFIPLAEENGEIDRLGMIALRDACQMAKKIAAQSLDMRLAVNVSPRQLFAKGFVPQVLRILEQEQIDPQSIELEITESAIMDDMERATRIMGDLVIEGIRFVLDDFGTGYSSLSYLRMLPIAGFKVDRSFVLDLADNRETQAICTLFGNLARDLRLEFTVEGVETEGQIDYLRKFPDAVIQGYYYSKPLPPDQFSAYISAPALESKN